MTETTAVASARARLGQVGVWIGAALNTLPAAAVRETAAELEELGYGSVWVGETPTSKDPFAHAGVLLAATRQLVVGTGIASIWLRDSNRMHAGAATLGEAYPGRFILGVGVSHEHALRMAGRTYERPYTRMREYLDGMDAADQSYRAPRPGMPVPRVLAALRSKMLELARDRADGAHPYFVPTAHTARAREVLGPEPLLIPEQAVVLATDPARAREVAREHVSFYLAAPNYTRNLRTLGYTDDDLTDGGSDRLVDAVVAWGDAEAIRSRVKEHLDAGADHVLVQPIVPGRGLGLEQLRELAAALVE